MSDNDFDDGQSIQSTQLTQETLDPRRLGLNHSGLHAEDVADVICILHPSTPAAYKLTQEYSRKKPQFCLQYRDLPAEAPDLEEEVTFILDEEEAARQGQAPLDLAFRFSNTTKQRHVGLTFGRNPQSCDIAITRDSNRRISNTHFCIHLNETGVLMIKDLSTNGTMVDDTLLKARTNHHPHSRMLTQGSVIQVLSPSHGEIIKFIVRFPSRDAHFPAYENALQNYLIRQAEIIRQWRIAKGLPVGPPDFTPRRHTTFTALMPNNQYGMRWSGGEVYNVVGHIGKGAFASVYQLATKLDGHLYAAKELEKRRFMRNGVLDTKLDNEMKIMQSISHDSVVAYHDFKEVDDYLYIIMEYVPCGDLQQYIGQHGPVPEGMSKQMAYQVLDALDYLHKKNITHRDIKPDNILLKSTDSDNFIVKLSDFGLSKAINTNDTFLKTFCGTLLYCAPEVFPHYDSHPAPRGVKRSREPRANRKFHSYSHAVDIWSFGAVLWYTLCHKPPFEGIADATGRGMFDNIMHTPLDVSELEKHGVSDAAIDLLVSMLDTNPLTRYSAEDCLRHAWFGLAEPPQRPYQIALHDIQEEEHDAVSGAQQNVACLSLEERVTAAASARGGHQEEVSLNESDLDFFDPRESKRMRTLTDEREHADFFDSSPDLMGSNPIVSAGGQAHAQALQDVAPENRPPKLFGEISQSDLRNRGHVRQPNGTTQLLTSSTESQVEVPSSQSEGAIHSGAHNGSLLGTEVLVRDMDIESPYLPSSFEVSQDGNAHPGPCTPTTKNGSSKQTPQIRPLEACDETPRQPVFTRRFVVPISASCYYDPADPSTHNAEYASRVSGHDFVNEPDYYPKERVVFPPRRLSASNTAPAPSIAPPVEAPPLFDPPLAKGDPVGRLVTTPDSFADITVELKQRKNTFGRDKYCTTSYQDKMDTRVGKHAFTIFLHATGIENIPEGEEHLDALPGAYVGILTHSSNGVSINGHKLNKAERPGRQTYGKLHHGDVVEVWPRIKDRKGLAFIAEIFQGEGKNPRPAHAPAFEVEMESSFTAYAYDTDYATEAPPSNQTATV
ncbi:hypothetical protein CERZMDRAFT_51064 [Cercospora zeae-maydis SCOH1-5]|uniref:non-specific serine/threonine protein kinase n=1 Tax=Cercospora zeae-maydis SCOH1-5 TaxID=717836 RepID=A0A6A6F4P7_9PEZI|nr:hypothetical protein CERZMDRAFT_51064 [Cercospora zeae-maydis SCOH1-5]